MIGQSIGPYQVLAKLGEGGMGQVYRARDLTLNRDVALKVLPEAFAQDPERLTRFAREAQALAALNHPNIAQIYGIVESGSRSPEDQGSTPVRALVMELVEGDDLSHRIAHGAMPIEDVMPIARQIAEALEAAHEQGIVHRDLKPANIKVRPDGVVKVLDFGLAKAMDSRTSGPQDPSNSPTLTNRATALGVILGTAAYMAPEQARGKSVDRRADVWAFGVVLLEMLTGRAAFTGEEASDILAQVITAEPDWARLPAATPTAVRRLLRRCLEKDPKRRLRDIGDARLELDDARESRGDQATADEALVVQRRGARRYASGLGWGVAAVLSAAILITTMFESDAQAPARPVQFTIDRLGSVPVSGVFAVSPDGASLAMAASLPGQKSAIWIRSLSELESRALPGTEGASDPFWSPDSQSIGFFAGGQILHVKVASGLTTPGCEAGSGGGATWSRDGVIVFGAGASAGAGGLRRCDDGRPITQVEGSNVRHAWPTFLPDGRHILYIAIMPERTELRVVSLDGATSRTIGPSDTNAVFSAGHLIYRIGDRLVAQAFDTSSLQTTGEPVPIAMPPPLASVVRRKAAFSASSDGLLVYLPLVRTLAQLTWVDRNGRPTGTVGEPGVYPNMNLDPSGRRLAVSRITGSPENADIWLIDFDRAGQMMRLTEHKGADHDPGWSPDGRTLIFNSNRQGTFMLFRKPADPEAAEQFIVGGGTASPEWSGPAKAIFYSATAQLRDIWVLPLDEDQARPFLATRFNEREPAPSPDGRFLAYESDKSSRQEIYVRPYPVGEPEDRVSLSGGTSPRWRGDGKEIVFVALDGQMMGAAVETSPGLRISPPKALFPTGILTGNGHPYAVTNDGKRFLIAIPVRDTTARPTPLTVMTNFLAGVNR